MCRHLAYLGPPRTLAEVLIEPPHGLYRQAWEPRRQRHGTVNADGFGIGWYPDSGSEPAPEPARYRRSVPVWADANLPDLARVLTTRALLAAVRDATPGMSQDESAAAPFRSGRWLFSHNGAVPDWERLPTDLPPPALLSLDAHCDSALLWAELRTRLEAGATPGAALAAVTAHTAAARPGARLNLLLTDGRTIAATCWGDTLFHRAGPDGVVVASEPDDTGGWHEVPDRSLLLATPEAVRTEPLHPAPLHPGKARAA